MNASRIDDDPAARRQISELWKDAADRKMDDPGYLESWWSSQCGGCRFWLPLSGRLGDDFGGCANRLSPRFMLVSFEHDGCDFYEPGGPWHEPPG